MAAKEVPPQRVRNILMSFLVRPTDKETVKGSGESNSQIDSAEDSLSSSDHRNKDAFNRRVETYTTLKWLAKPNELSPLVCARYGWENTETDMLKCVSCKSILCGKLPNVKNTELYKECVRKLKESLIQAHQELCPWRTNPSPDSFLTASFHSQEETMQELMSSYMEFTERDVDYLPVISFETLGEIALDEVSFQAELTTRSNGSTPVCRAIFREKPVNLPAFLLTLFGWKRSKSQPQVIVCERCRRQVGLWGFRRAVSGQNGTPTGSIDLSFQGETTPPKTSGHTEQDSEGTNSAKKIKLGVKDSFDPISEHKSWCPWVAVPAGVAQKSSSSSSPNAHQISSPLSVSSTPESQRMTNLRDNSTISDVSTCNLLSPSNSLPNLPNGQSLSSPENPSPATSFMSPVLTNQLDDPPQLPAWQMLLVMLSLWKPVSVQSGCGELKSSPPIEGMRRIRRMLREWTSPRSIRRSKTPC